MRQEPSAAPLAGLRAVVSASGVAAAYAGRLLSVLGAETTLVEPPGGSPLRLEPPFLDAQGQASALFAYLATGASSQVCDLETEAGRKALGALLEAADIFVDDTPLAQRQARGLDQATVAKAHPQLVHVSVLPFGAIGPKADWKAEEINALHASGEGFLLPNGLTLELFPDRPPVKIYGNFSLMQGGIAAALGALSAVWARPQAGGQFVDISVQDAGLAVGCFAVQRYGDGSVENRHIRSFKYGGVIECADGFVELLTLEQRQWTGLVELLGRPDWATDPALADSLERSRQGAAINARLREWAKGQKVADVVSKGQALGVPLAKYAEPSDLLSNEHEKERGFFAPISVPGAGEVQSPTAPFRFRGAPPPLRRGPPALNEHDQARPASVPAGQGA